MVEHDKSEFNFFFNGEPATTEQLLLIDQKVDELMLGISAIITQGFTVVEPDREIELYFETVKQIEDDETVINPSLELLIEGEEELSISFNRQTGAYVDPDIEPDWEEVHEACESLMVYGQTDEASYGVIERLRDASRAAKRNINVEEVLSADEWRDGPLSPVEAIIRTVHKNHSYSIVYRCLELPLSSPFFIEIETYELDGRILQEELAEMPKTLLKLFDEITGRTYVYVKQQNDEHQQELASDDETGDRDITYQNPSDYIWDTDVKNFKQQIGLYEVGKTHATIIERALREASMLDTDDISLSE